MDPKTGSSELAEITNIPLGSHFCLFYETRKDLLEAVTPFFQQGLEEQEYCLWISALPVRREEAGQALSEAIAGFSDYLNEGQIEIIPHTDWYLTIDGFDADHVLQAWVDKLDNALARGYTGMRCVGDTFWLEKHHWNSFTQYEARLDSVLSPRKMKVLCTYPLERCSAETVLDVIEQHQFTLFRRKGKWQRLERGELRRLQDEVQRLNSELQRHLLGHHLEQPIAEAGAPAYEDLSPREQEVLRLIAQGKTNRDIAGNLGLSIRTVERYRSSIMKKLGLHNSAGLIVYAVTHGFLKSG